ncbi:metal-dependent hydrolase family protein [Vibrio breoganii]|uniref:metal-dependent hydrolase family protein n=1 Tax=Vibrio breoganii TaxID=553239 RepID=UPI000C82AB1F|nr:amidohydrolase family protein [Vibrio breoganii]PML37392.1 amidohydrolase [Vibrio breoganii]PMO76615.1 amidohydrolase [Vibrio breoganii]PMO89499.1 amidohydrolase [Vibrio breoganii]PMP06303.1 amidohydrolase [Vibrio breoganii]
MKNVLKLSAVAISCSLAFSASAATTIFKNVDIFNGTEDKLYEDHHVMVVDNKIAQISSKEIKAEDATVIDGEGKTLMPGLIDGHAHIMINYNFDQIEKNKDLTDISINSVTVAERFLQDGFTTVRDMGGPAFGLMREIEAGNVAGPRIYPSGGFISQTSGHGDFRDRSDAGFSIQSAGDISNFERMGIGAVADGVPEVQKATRLNLRNGATQIKIMAGGGGSSRFDPIDTTQYSVEETCAIVEAAKDWNTYVAAHVFNDRSVNRLLDCGVKTFEHGFFINDETMQRISKEGGYVVPQMWGLSPDLAKNPLMPKDKLPLIAELRKKYGTFGQRLLENEVKVVFASDYVGVNSDAERARRYEIYWRAEAFGSNYEVLKQMTSNAGEMLAMSGPRGTAKGKLGVIEKDAIADIILVEGNPLEDMSVIGATDAWFDADPEYKEIETIKLVMKDGKIYRNKL